MAPKRSSRPGARPHRVVLSGGPAAGKTAVLEIIRRHLTDDVAVVPEAATILFSGGFPRREGPAAKRLVQRAIFDVQRANEAIHEVIAPKKPHVLDRGSIDGAAYWPGGAAKFFDAMKTTTAREYARYDAVIFLETTAYDIVTWPHDNPYRTETPADARAVDRRLRRIWGRHPRFHFIPHSHDFYEKVALCLITLHKILGVGRPDVPGLAR